jgi:hypothetical protein
MTVLLSGRRRRDCTLCDPTNKRSHTRRKQEAPPPKPKPKPKPKPPPVSLAPVTALLGSREESLPAPK